MAYIRTKEIRDKIRKSVLEFYQKAPLSFFEGLRRVHSGRRPSLETRRKMSISATGRIVSPETRAKLSKSSSKTWEDLELRKRLSLMFKGRHVSKETREKIKLARAKQKMTWKGSKHHLWKGEKASYEAFHNWVHRHFGRPTKCENIECIYPRRSKAGVFLKEPKRFEWALIKGKEHGHNRDNYAMLCPSCHRRYDRGSLNLSFK